MVKSTPAPPEAAIGLGARADERLTSAAAARDPFWWRGAVMYQIYPRSFQDSDGDGVGDLAGVRQRLPYLASLGVEGLWICPVFPSPMRDFGYDVSDYLDIDPLFGDLAGFDALLAEAHAAGLRVIIDQVYSHTSDEHPWFKESRAGRSGDKSDWYVWADPKADGSPPSNWLAAFGGGMWEWDSSRRQYYLHNFLPSQPDLDLSKREVQDALLQVARFWLDRGVDGFRLDVANCFVCDPAFRDNPPSGARASSRPYGMQRHIYDRDRPESLVMAARLRALVDERPGRFLLAELASDDPEAAIGRYAGGADRYHTAYAFRFLSKPFGAEVVRAGVEALQSAAPQAWPSYAFSNHDFERAASRWGEAREQPLFAKTLLMLLTSLRGTAFIYQGEELGLPQAVVPRAKIKDPDGLAFWPAYKGRDGCRTPMPWRSEAANGGFSEAEPWLPLDLRHVELAVDRQEADAGSTLNFLRRWLSFRRSEPALRQGEIAFPARDPQILTLDRTLGEERLRLVFNLGSAPSPLLNDASWEEVFRNGEPGPALQAGAAVVFKARPPDP